MVSLSSASCFSRCRILVSSVSILGSRVVALEVVEGAVDGAVLTESGGCREKRLVGVGDEVEAGRADAEMADELEMLDFLLGAGFVTKGFASGAATDNLF